MELLRRGFMTFIFNNEMDKGLEDYIKRKHLTHIVLLQSPLLEESHTRLH